MGSPKTAARLMTPAVQQRAGVCHVHQKRRGFSDVLQHLCVVKR
jgi:hypothetical protein